jgi:hypothetical protein
VPGGRGRSSASPSEVRGGSGWEGHLAAPCPSSRGVGLGFRVFWGLGSAILVSRALSGLGVGYPASEVFPEKPRAAGPVGTCRPSSHTVAASFRVSDQTSGPDGLGQAEAVLAVPGASPGVLFPSASLRRGGPLYPGLPHPARSALEVSHLRSGLLLLRPPGFVSPQFRSWDFPFRAFPSARAGAPLGALSPPAVLAARPPRMGAATSVPGQGDDGRVGFRGLFPRGVRSDRAGG